MEEIEHLHIWDIVGEEDRTGIEAEVESLIATFKTEESTLHVLEDGWNRRKDGSTYPVSVQMQYFGGENPPVLVGICRDVTERRLRDEQVRLRERAIEAIEAGIVISDASLPGYPIVYANRALGEMTGYAVDELIGRSPSLLQQGLAAQPGAKRVRDAQARGMSVQTRLDCVRRDGSRFVTRLTLSPVHDPDGTLTHYIGIHEDVTRESETGARLLQAQRIDAVGRLAGGIAHDFNNLLDIVVGNLELLAADSLGRTPLARVDEAHRAASMGARLTRRLLAFARQGSLEPSVVDVNEQVRGMLPLLRSSVGESVVLETELDDSLWCACVDPSEIENTVVNLVLNARDAVVGGGRIRIATSNVRFGEDGRDDLDPGSYVRLSVLDDGHGMSEALRARAVEPFFTTKELGRGTGLGLSSIHGFARQSGGAIEIESEPGGGTTVSVYLPRADGECDGGDGDRATPPGRSSGGRVLVVEDNARVREITLLRLQSLGLETLEASDGVQARRLLESGEHVDLVLSDIVMPGGTSGHDLARWIRDSGRGCPVLLVSGFAEPAAEVDRPEGAAPPRVLAKPYSLETLREAIDDVLASSRA